MTISTACATSSAPRALAALVLFVAAGAFMTLVLQPLKEKNRVLEPRPASVATSGAAASANAAEKVGAVYEYLKKPESTTDWLAKLYAIGKATGVELRQPVGGLLGLAQVAVDGGQLLAAVAGAGARGCRSCRPWRRARGSAP